MIGLRYISIFRHAYNFIYFFFFLKSGKKLTYCFVRAMMNISNKYFVHWAVKRDTALVIARPWEFKAMTRFYENFQAHLVLHKPCLSNNILSLNITKPK